MTTLNANIEGGLELVNESKLQFIDLVNYLENSPLKGMYNLNLPDPQPEQPSPKDIQSICKGLEQLLLEDLTYEKLTSLFVASSKTYLMSSNFQDFECRTELLHKTFRYANSLDPVNLHIAAKRIHENLKSNANLLFLCKNICFCNEMANGIATCLLWAMFLETLGKEIEMYCFHPFSLINELLVDVDVNEMVRVRETSVKAHFLLQLISALISSVISKSNEELITAGYSQYFRYDTQDIHNLKDWARAINERITVSIKSSNTNYDHTMAIKETIIFNIMSPLNDTLKTIDGGCDGFRIVPSTIKHY